MHWHGGSGACRGDVRMRIALAQAKAVAGDLATNAAHHLDLVRLAISHGKSAVISARVTVQHSPFRRVGCTIGHF